MRIGLERKMRHLGKEEWIRGWHPVMERVFDRESDRHPFRDHSWRMLPIPEYLWADESPALLRIGGPPAVHEFDPLLATLKELGEEEICVDGLFLPSPTVVKANRGDVASLSRVDHPAYLCGRSGSWGMVADEGRLTILGGSEAFMACYLRHAGGIATVRKRFEDHDIGMGWEPAWPRDDEGYRRWREGTYATFGWTPFAYPNQGTAFARIPDEKEVNRHWLPAYRAVFAAPPTSSIPDATKHFPPEWYRLTLPGHLIRDGGNEARGSGYYVRPVLDAWWGLTAALGEAEDWEIGITPLNEGGGEDWTVTLAWVRGLQSVGQLADRPVAALGTQGRWGLISFSDGVSILAADKPLLERVITWAGGAAMLRQELENWCTTADVSLQTLHAIGMRATS
jgi:hypothetical protein